MNKFKFLPPFVIPLALSCGRWFKQPSQLGAIFFKIKKTPYRGLGKDFDLLNLCSVGVQLGESRIGNQSLWSKCAKDSRRENLNDRVDRYGYSIVGNCLGRGNRNDFKPRFWQSLIRRASEEGWKTPTPIYSIIDGALAVDGTRKKT